MNKIFQVLQYLKFILRSKNEYGIHSPFVYNLITDVLKNNEKFYCYVPIEKLRRSLQESNESVEVVDYGAGSQLDNGTKRTVKSIARNSAKSPFYAQMLFRLANHFKSKTIVELGTSLGISTSYLAACSSKTKIFTIEGSLEISKLAQTNFRKLGIKNIETISGPFSEKIPEVLKKCKEIDLVFFDGDHRKEPTLQYFNMFLQYKNENSIFIFDDIYWSPGMLQAWEEIKKHPQVTVTIDLYQIGIVFFRKDQAKEHFRIRL